MLLRVLRLWDFDWLRWGIDDFWLSWSSWGWFRCLWDCNWCTKDIRTSGGVEIGLEDHGGLGDGLRVVDDGLLLGLWRFDDRGWDNNWFNNLRLNRNSWFFNVWDRDNWDRDDGFWDSNDGDDDLRGWFGDCDWDRDGV